MRKDFSVDPEDKQKVLDWMHTHAFGFRNARTRADILPFLQSPEEMTDRVFRLCASELIHEGHLCSSASRGYWAVPLVTKDQEEIQAVIEAQEERKGKALDLLADCDRVIKIYQEKKRCITQQSEFELAGAGK